jgi:uncharacterized protein YceH (UPF0502 family)
MVELNVVEARVLGSLMEKEMTTPEYYPLSLNALVNACNQKSSRDPVLELSESDVRGVLFSLDELGLARTLADGRVSKFEHRTRDRLNLRRDEFALICLLLLRGPQTPAELRARAERLYSFDDTAAVTATLERLASREEPLAPLTRILPRQPGAREARWTQLLSLNSQGGELNGDQGVPPPEQESPGNLHAQRIDALEQSVRTLEVRLQQLEGRLRAVDPDDHGGL